MSIPQKIRIIKRTQTLCTELKGKYAHRKDAAHDLTKLEEALHKLIVYLEKIDALKPDKTTDHIEELMSPVNLDIVILKGELEKSDYSKLNKGIRAVKATLKFHPTKTSFLEFVVLWFYELVYFI